MVAVVLVSSESKIASRAAASMQKGESMLSAQQLEVRSKGIGASESPALLGLSPYETAIDVYMRKLGLVENIETFHTERGNMLEPSLREWASNRIGIDFMPCDTLVSKRVGQKHVLATPDGICIGGGRCTTLELKSPGSRTWHEWGDGDEAPDRYVVQVAQQMLCANADTGYLAALVDDDLVVYRYERDEELQDSIANAIESFWKNHIETRTPPPVDGSIGADTYLLHRFPRNTRANLVVADMATEGLMLVLKRVREEQKALDTKRSFLEQRIKEVIGEASGIESPVAGKITWECSKDTDRTNWKEIAKHMNPPDDLIRKYTETKPGARVFRPWFK
jgi:putative phage-type endonuclease